MRRKAQRGLTLAEIIAAFTSMLVLTTMAVPLEPSKVRSERERDPKNAVTGMRHAIDKYKDVCDNGYLGPPKRGIDCYPESLDQLVVAVKLAQSADGKKVRFQRRIPRDPFNGQTGWGLRSDQDDPSSDSWGGQNVLDVYSKTAEKAPDGTNYSDWH